MERTESEGFYEMLWDCDHCGQKGLLGKSQRHCAQCGAPQNPDKRYMPTPEQQQRVEGHTFVGADRTCPACSAPMGAAAKNCTQCGSPLDAAKEVRGVADAPLAAPKAPPKHRRRLWPWLLGLVVLAGGGVAIWFAFIRAHSAQVVVAAHRWERAIAIEQYGDHQESAWREQVPPGTSLPMCVAKQRSTRQVDDGEDCHIERHDKKDGTFEQVKKCKPKTKSEPVNDEWCTFSIRKWMKVDDVKTSGDGMTPAWPTDDKLPPANAAPVLGTRRAGARTETLTLDLGGGRTCDVDDPTWRKYADGQKVKVEVRARSDEVVCGSL